MSNQSLADQVPSDIQSLQSSLRELQNDVRLSSVRDSVEDLQTEVNGMDQRIASLRERGYAFEKELEEKAADFAEQWTKLSPNVTSQIERESQSLGRALRPLENQITSLAGKSGAPAITNNPRPLSTPHPRIMIGGMGPKKTLRMVAQYADACNFFEGAGKEKMQSALDTLKAHCERLDRDYDAVEKTSLGTVHLSENDTVDSVIKRIRELSAMGFTHTIFNMPDVYQVTPLETFAKEIVPAVAEL